MFQESQMRWLCSVVLGLGLVLLAACAKPLPAEAPPEGPPPDEPVADASAVPAEPAVAPEGEAAAKVKEALAAMKAGAVALGEPTLDGDNLVFGPTAINHNFEIVDSIHEKYGCDATFFAKQGDGFTRVSTSVMRDGERAVGTELDAAGPVLEQIRKGEAYYGQADALGKLYETGYEPIQNAAGETIGVYGLGYLVEQ